MRLTLAILILAVLPSSSLHAQVRESTYEALIDDEVFVRSGPGRNHYHTGKLGRGDRVTVHRREPGGWLMISPPAGSFDWIAADNIEVNSQPTANRPGQGTVLVNNSVVWIGSEIEEESRDIWHVTLARGKRVAILGEKVFNTSQGARRYYKIQPPAGDHRWILGQFVRRIDADSKQVDPFDMPYEGGDLPSPDRRQKRQRKRARDLWAEQDHETGYDDHDQRDGGELKRRRMVRTTTPKSDSGGKGSIRTGPSQEELQDDRVRISKLDARFREILRSETSQWDFRTLEQDYKNLQRSAAHDAIRRQVNLRLRKVAQYKKIQAEHDEFVRLTRESDEREAQILSLRSQAQTGGRQQPTRRRFSGAGIIQRSIGAPRGAPVHALVAPGGRVLAYLQAAPGINLDRYLGRAMGLNGPRTHRREWGTDHIIVEKLTPVRLKTQSQP